MRRRTYLGLVGTALVCSIAGCSGDGGGSTTVRMTDDLRFDPEVARVASGAAVEWENPGRIAHTVTAYADRIPASADYFASGGFDSEAAARENLSAGLVEAGETYSHTFEVEGEYAYFCIPHEGSGMSGTVRVS